ncbi:MAG: hypothetical protein RML95_05200 [Anaerolineae bacterium]|nr:hypothetical protein [Anaerolineae bacterium]MDW8298714.1 hypothetical protein [Anaerolineae bacterium]
MDKYPLSRFERTRRLLKIWLNVPELPLGCDDCAEHMDCLVELLLADASPIGFLAAVQRHIQHCECCRSEFEALLSILRMERADTP